MEDKIITTFMVTLGNIAVTNLANIGTRIASNKLIEDKKIRSTVNTIVPIVTCLGVGAATSGIIIDAWSTDTEIMDDEVVDTESSDDGVTTIEF